MPKTLRFAIVIFILSLAANSLIPAQTATTTTSPSTAAAVDAALPKPPPPPEAAVQPYLNRGDLAAAAKAMSDTLAANRSDDQARFSLGVVQVLQSVEHLSQSFYKFGIKSDQIKDIVSSPIPENPNPKTVSYEDVRQMNAQFRADVLKAEGTLAMVKDPNVKLPIRIGMVRLDFTGAGHPPEEATLWRVLAGMWHNPDVNDASARNFVICFDLGDVYWLRGYCRLLAGLCDLTLAYNEKDLFEHCAHLFFKSVDSPFRFLQSGKKIFDLDGVDVVDVIAWVHLLHFPVQDRLQFLDARTQFKEMIADSKMSWKLIQAETDDDHEWIPNPRQHAAIPHVEVTQPMIDSWLKFMDEFNDILDGKKLIPFWRGDGTQGVNLAKLFFTDPQPFDLVLWVQGTGVAPALEKGPLTDPDIYRNLGEAFNGNIYSFGAWFN